MIDFVCQCAWIPCAMPVDMVQEFSCFLTWLDNWRATILLHWSNFIIISLFHGIHRFFFVFSIRLNERFIVLNSCHDIFGIWNVFISLVFGCWKSGCLAGLPPWLGIHCGFNLFRVPWLVLNAFGSATCLHVEESLTNKFSRSCSIFLFFVIA